VPDQPIEAEVRASFEQLSNAGRWGPEDELGTLNLITPEHRRRAAGLIERGEVVSLAHVLNPQPDGMVRQALLPQSRGIRGASDRVDIAPHGFAITHLDALGHVAFDEWLYNGRRVDQAIAEDGLRFGSIAAARGGIVTRGMLLDVASARGLDYLEAGDLVEPEDLDRAAELAGLRPEAGDAVLVRVGLGRRVAKLGPEDPTLRAGLSPRCPAWFRDRDVALFGGDCIERLPSGYGSLPLPFHALALAAIGLPILDNVDMERLREACAAFGRASFLLVVAPLPIERATGSAVNPLAIF
jgi:kynurenine formamidase